ncbi:MAG: metallophosphoesterase [Planctomycetes bacterium]|nr:metallophosphoesterase [Planctomycetota bacterium]
MLIAVFGDVHGHLRLMFQLCRLWQLHHGVHLDLVLQCGDLGFFPDLGRLDKATRRYVHWDPEEAGFARYFVWPSPPERWEVLERILRGPPEALDTVRCPVIWCHGNHEDFQELERIAGGSALAPVDAFESLQLLRAGRVTCHEGLRVAALGGGPEPPGVDDDDDGLEDPWKWVSARAASRLRTEDFDVLLTHASPAGIAGPGGPLGSARVRDVICARQPAYQLYAHHRRPIPPGTLGSTRCHYLGDVNFEGTKAARHGPLHAGCMGLLRWDGPEDHEFLVADEPWMRAVTWESWETL